jgi:hypothetical protein
MYTPSKLARMIRTELVTLNQSGIGTNATITRPSRTCITPKIIALNIFDDGDFNDVTYAPIITATSPRVSD